MGAKTRIAALATTAALAGGVVLPAAAPSSASAMKFQSTGQCWAMRTTIAAQAASGFETDGDMLAVYLARCWR